MRPFFMGSITMDTTFLHLPPTADNLRNDPNSNDALQHLQILLEIKHKQVQKQDTLSEISGSCLLFPFFVGSSFGKDFNRDGL